MVTAVARLPVAPGTTLQLSAASGERAVGGVSLRGTGFGATLQTPLAAGLSSRTILSGGKVGPLFAARSVGEELSYRTGATELRGGARLTRYAGGLDVRSVHAGLAREAGPVRLDYAFAAYGREGALGGGMIHRFDGALNDFSGSTHLMLAAGSSLHEHDFRPDRVTGSFRFAGLKRQQKLGRGLALELTGGWTAFSRPKGEYGAARIGAGLSFAR
jgi:YaiO family outer membrane protein